MTSYDLTTDGQYVNATTTVTSASTGRSGGSLGTRPTPTTSAVVGTGGAAGLREMMGTGRWVGFVAVGLSVVLLAV